MRKLVFMDIASYLPCDLAYALVEQKNVVTLLPKEEYKGVLSVNGNQHNVNNNVLSDFPEHRCYKPILRDISSIGEEIEHNGKIFVPIVELLKIKHPYNDYLSRYGEIAYETNFPFKVKAFYCYRANFEISISLNNLLHEPYWVILKLIEWKFDIGRLIKDGLALDVNHLTFNPYK